MTPGFWTGRTGAGMLSLVLAGLFAWGASGTSGPGSEAAIGSARAISPAFPGTDDPLLAIGYDLPARMEELGVPGVSVAVFDEGEIAWARGYGVVEAGGSRPVTPETLFQAASISKPVAAMGVMLLAQEGTLDLDEDVNGRLRSWRIPASRLAEEEPVTLRRILTHRAGLTVHGFPGYPRGSPLPSLPEILNGAPPANTDPVRVTMVPGSEERYSGGGTTVAELLLEDVTGRSFPDLMEERVLAPLGMSRSTYMQPLPEERQEDAASAHDADGSPVEGGWHVYPERAAAGLWTTPTDLAHLAIDVQRALHGDPEALLGTAAAREMLAPAGGSFGIGFMVQGNGRAATFEHGGSNRGFRALLFALREEGRGVAVMTNGANGTAITREVVAAVVRNEGWLPEP